MKNKFTHSRDNERNKSGKRASADEEIYLQIYCKQSGSTKNTLSCVCCSYERYIELSENSLAETNVKGRSSQKKESALCRNVFHFHE